MDWSCCGGCGEGEDAPLHFPPACAPSLPAAPSTCPMGSRQSLESRVFDAISGRPGTELLLSEREAARTLLSELRETLAGSRREAEEAVAECTKLRVAKDQLEGELIRVTEERDALRVELERARGKLDDREEEVFDLRSKVRHKRPL